MANPFPDPEATQELPPVVGWHTSLPERPRDTARNMRSWFWLRPDEDQPRSAPGKYAAEVTA